MTEATGYTSRWRQRHKPTKNNPRLWNAPVTGKRVYAEDELKILIATCQKVNAGYGGDIEQWPVRYELGKWGKPTNELAELRELVGLQRMPSDAEFSSRSNAIGTAV